MRQLRVQVADFETFFERRRRCLRLLESGPPSLIIVGRFFPTGLGLGLGLDRPPRIQFGLGEAQLT